MMAAVPKADAPDFNGVADWTLGARVVEEALGAHHPKRPTLGLT